MKKITSIAVAALLLAPAGFISAQVATSTPSGNGDPMLVGMIWGLTGAQTPRVDRGTVVHDAAGISFPCPVWYGYLGCFDITKTDYYRNGARDTARQLRDGGFALGQYSYWLTH